MGPRPDHICRGPGAIAAGAGAGAGVRPCVAISKPAPCRIETVVLVHLSL